MVRSSWSPIRNILTADMTSTNTGKMIKAIKNSPIMDNGSPEWQAHAKALYQKIQKQHKLLLSNESVAGKNRQAQKTKEVHDRINAEKQITLALNHIENLAQQLKDNRKEIELRHQLLTETSRFIANINGTGTIPTNSSTDPETHIIQDANIDAYEKEITRHNKMINKYRPLGLNFFQSVKDLKNKHGEASKKYRIDINTPHMFYEEDWFEDSFVIEPDMSELVRLFVVVQKDTLSLKTLLHNERKETRFLTPLLELHKSYLKGASKRELRNASNSLASRLNAGTTMSQDSIAKVERELLNYKNKVRAAIAKLRASRSAAFYPSNHLIESSANGQIERIKSWIEKAPDGMYISSNSYLNNGLFVIHVIDNLSDYPLTDSKRNTYNIDPNKIKEWWKMDSKRHGMRILNITSQWVNSDYDDVKRAYKHEKRTDEEKHISRTLSSIGIGMNKDGLTIRTALEKIKSLDKTHLHDEKACVYFDATIKELEGRFKK